jgi:hypothetical protein
MQTPRFNVLSALSSISLAIIGLAASVFGVVYTTYTTSRQDYNRENIQSWTCRWVDGAANADKLFSKGLAAISAPEGFRRVCMEMHAGFALLCVLVGLEALVMSLAGVRLWTGIKARRAERNSVEGRMDEKGGSPRRFY